MSRRKSAKNNSLVENIARKTGCDYPTDSAARNALCAQILNALPQKERRALLRETDKRAGSKCGKRR